MKKVLLSLFLLNALYACNSAYSPDNRDRVDLNFPMHVEVRDGRETPYPQINYFVEGSIAAV